MNASTSHISSSRLAMLSSRAGGQLDRYRRRQVILIARPPLISGAPSATGVQRASPQRSLSALTPSARLAPTRSVGVRLFWAAAALGCWFWGQTLFGAGGVAASVIEDRVHAVTAPAKLYLLHQPAEANSLLVVSSGFMALLGIF